MIATSRPLGPLVRYRVCTASADTEGDIDALPLWRDRASGSRLTSSHIVCEIIGEAETVLGRLAQ